MNSAESRERQLLSVILETSHNQTLLAFSFFHWLKYKARSRQILGNLRGNNLDGNRNGNINRRVDVAVLPFFMLRKIARKKCKQIFSS